MDASQLRELSDAELVEKLEQFKEEQFKLRFRMATGQLDNYRRMQEVRRSIARVRTVQRERQLETEVSR